MKFSAPYEQFEQAVAIVSANPVTNILNDICQYILIESDTDNITLTKSDLDIHLKSSLKATIEKPGRALVHGDTLSKVLKTYKNLKKSDDCLVVFSSDSNKVTIGFSDNKKYRPAVLSTRDPEDFSPVDTFTGPIASCTMAATQLKDYFRKNMIAINRHESNIEFAGVYFKFKGKDIELVSSNRLDVVLIKATPLSVDYAVNLNSAFALIPRKTMDTVVKIASGEENIKVSISVDMVNIEGELSGVSFSVLNNTYDVPSAIDTNSFMLDRAENVILIPANALKNALTHMSSIKDQSIPQRISLAADGTSVTIGCKSPTGEIPSLPIESKIEKTNGESLLVLNDQKLAAFLQVVKSANVRFSFCKTGQKCHFEGDEEPFFTLVSGTFPAKTDEVNEVKRTTPSQIAPKEFADLSTIGDPIEDPEDIKDALGEIEVEL